MKYPVWLVCLLAACAAEVAPAPAPTVLTPVATLDLALGSEDSVLIGRLEHATRLPDGGVVAFDGDAMALVFLDSTGELIRSVGRAGAGPGEFQNPDWVAQCSGDSLFAFDVSLRRIAVFGPEGAFVRQFEIPTPQPFQMACNGRGVFAAFDASAVPSRPTPPGEEPAHLTGHLIIFDATGDSIGGIADMAIGQSRVLGPLASLAVLHDGVRIGISDSPIFRTFSFEGELRATDTFPVSARVLTDSLYNAELDRLAAFVSASPEMQLRIREMLAAAPKLPNLPLYQSMIHGRDGTIWLLTSIQVDPATTLVGFRDDETLALSLPGGFQVFEIGRDYVLGMGSDGDGAERLVVYRIER